MEIQLLLRVYGYIKVIQREYIAPHRITNDFCESVCGNVNKSSCQYRDNTHKIASHYQRTGETPYEWRFADRLMVA